MYRRLFTILSVLSLALCGITGLLWFTRGTLFAGFRNGTTVFAFIDETEEGCFVNAGRMMPWPHPPLFYFSRPDGKAVGPASNAAVSFSVGAEHIFWIYWADTAWMSGTAAPKLIVRSANPSSPVVNTSPPTEIGVFFSPVWKVVAATAAFPITLTAFRLAIAL